MTAATTELTVIRDDGEWSVARIVEQTKKVKECLQAVMIKDEHYGVIPNTQRHDGKPPKPTLLKPGAEKLCLMFRLCPEYETLRADSGPALVAYTVRCTLTHITTGNRVATGLGSCNSREKKYTRPAPKKCPTCAKEAIIKGKEEFGGGWLCWKKKDGCGAKFKDGDETIEKQDTGVEDPSDLDNTILKMACKRALIAAVLNGTAASDCFTQDLEDLTDKAAAYIVVEPEPVDPAYRETMREGGSGPKAPSAPSAIRPGVTDTAATPAPQTASGTTKGAGTADPKGVGSSATAGAGSGSTKPTKDFLPGDQLPAKAGWPAVTQKQIAEIHILRKDCNWDDWPAGEEHFDREVSAWPLYRKALGAYRKVDGERVHHSNELQEHQADNLIKRMRATKDRKLQKAAQVPDIGAVIPLPPPKFTAATFSNIDDAFQAAFDNDEDERAWIGKYLGFPNAREIPSEMSDEVTQLLFCWVADGKRAGKSFAEAHRVFQERRK